MLKIAIPLLILIIILGAGVLIYNSCSGGIVHKIDKSLPSITTAPYQVATRTHIYLTPKALTNADGSVTMSKWYERLDKKWVLQTKTITLPPVLHPSVSKRETQ